MCRPKGIGMRRPQKKKVAAMEDMQAAMAAPIRAAVHRHAPHKPSPLSQMVAVAPPSPLRQPLEDCNSKFAEAVLYTKLAEKQLKKDRQQLAVAIRIYSAKGASVARSLERGQTDRFKLARKLHKASDALWEARLQVALMQAVVMEAQRDEKSAMADVFAHKVVQLRGDLHRAQRAQKARARRASSRDPVRVEE